MRWCRSCVLPDTRPNLEIGDDGVCNACRAHASKRGIDWAARAEAFREVVARARRESTGYDCVIPVSGGKDSTWQVVTCLEAGLKPLAVTWKTPGRTAIGAANLANLVALGVDHIDYQVSPVTERRFMRAALARFGDPAIPMHMALFAIPLRIALRFRIPLVVWGENSAFEYGGTEEERRGFALDGAWLRKYGVTHGTSWRDWIGGALAERDLVAYALPAEAELAAAGTRAIFLGYYFPWDPKATLAVASAHGFRPRSEGPKTGYYDYADIDDDFISVHHWFKWYKFGFTRLFDNLSLEIRNDRMTRERAIDIIRERGEETPQADIAALCRFLDMPKDEFFALAERFRNPRIWERSGGRWIMPEFLIPDWDWR
ncbi:MAG TPA: N-acetyl sugar amidotransferase [Stellaceae bacterium]|nr:N-acetyl sugar amidotransferase [Stellaceae bacterium]